MAVVDMSKMAAVLRAYPPNTLPWPRQGSYGNCWLLTAIVALQHHYPRLLLDMITLHPQFAIVQLPRRPPVQIDYMLPPKLVRIREAADLYYALVCKAICVILSEGGAWHKCLYSACHGGQVSIALQMLCPTHPPLVFCEILRDNMWHSLFLLQHAGSHLACYDPHHGNITVPAQSCNIIAYNSCPAGASAGAPCGRRPCCRILGTGPACPS